MTSHLPTLQQMVFSSADDLSWIEGLPGEAFVPRIAAHHTTGVFSVTEAVIAPQAGPPLHIHHDADEWLYVLDGRVHFICDGKRFDAGAGGLLGIPRGVRHAFRNFGDRPARMLGILTPAGFERFLFDMEGRQPADIARLGPDYGLEIVGPQIDTPEGLLRHADLADSPEAQAVS